MAFITCLFNNRGKEYHRYNDYTGSRIICGMYGLCLVGQVVGWGTRGKFFSYCLKTPSIKHKPLIPIYYPSSANIEWRICEMYMPLI